MAVNPLNRIVFHHFNRRLAALRRYYEVSFRLKRRCASLRPSDRVLTSGVNPKQIQRPAVREVV
jgi:hypothetical protein